MAILSNIANDQVVQNKKATHDIYNCEGLTNKYKRYISTDMAVHILSICNILLQLHGKLHDKIIHSTTVVHK